MSENLSRVFHKAQFSQAVVASLGEAAVERIEVALETRTMYLYLLLPNAVTEEAVRTLKQELLNNFPTLMDIQIETNPPLIISTGSILGSGDESSAGERAHRTLSGAAPQGFRPQSRARKVKVNKTIPTDRRLLSEELIDNEDICVEGIVFNLNRRVLKSGRILITFDMHGRNPEDLYSAVSVKLFTQPGEDVPLKKGAAVTVRGKVQYDDYINEQILLADTIAPGREPEIRPDNAEEKRVELHLHTTMSALDAVSTASAYVKRAAYWGHPAIAITDHGVAQAFPEAADAARKTGVKVLYGVEAYLVDDISNDPKALSTDKQKKIKYSHAVIFAANQAGLKNLYSLISMAHLEHFYRRPRILKSTLLKRREGLIIGSACEAGELYRAVRAGKPDDELEELAGFYDYLEIQPLDNNAYMLRQGLVSSEEEIMNFNRKIVALGEKLNKPVVATCDAHFLDSADEVFRRIIQAGDGFAEADTQAPLFYRTTDEMLAEFTYLGEEKAYEVVVTNTRAIADSIEEMSPIPQKLYPPVVPNAEEDVEKLAMEQARNLYGDPLPQMVADRMEQELRPIINNGFAGMYMISQKIVAESMANGYLVGSRGSLGSSLVATMIGITEVNPLPPHYFCIACHYFESDPAHSGISGFDLPVKSCPNCGETLKKDGHDIPFETFLGFYGGDKEPDIDLNFSGVYQQAAHAHAEALLGKGQVFKSGTIATIAEKTAYGYVKKYFESRNQPQSKANVNRLVAGCTGIKKTTGQHPGGLIVVPVGHSIDEFCPVQHPANQVKSGVITTHFDFHSLEGSLLKLDLLGHDVPTILHLLHKFSGLDPRSVPLDDKDVLNFFTNADSLGLPEFGTNFVRQMLQETRPTSFTDLVRISGLSHGTNVWTNNGQDLVKNGIATLRDIIPGRDDIMVYLIHKNVDKQAAFQIMESVRKGKGLKDEWVDLMLDAGVPDWYIDSCRKIEYLFPKAHAVAYVLMTVRIAYYKLYHPEAFYAATFSVKANDFDYANMCMGEDTARAKYIKLKEREAAGRVGAENKNGAAASTERTADSAKDKSNIVVMEMVLEMYSRGLKFAPLDVYKSEVSEFKPTPDGLLPPLYTVSGLGQSAAEAIVEARKDGPFVTVEDFKKRTGANKTVLNLLKRYMVLYGIPETNQMSLFD